MIRAVLVDQFTIDQAEAQVAAPADPRDAAFARALVRACFRCWVRCSAVQSAFLTKALPSRALDAEIALRLGITQLLALELPPHAAISATVELIGTNQREKPLRGVVNGVLRAIDRERSEALRHFNGPPSGVAPKWLLKRWQKAHGKQSALEMLAHLEQSAALCISTKPGWVPPFEVTRLAENCFELPASVRDPRGLEGFDAGDFWVQDSAASAPARCLLTVLEGQADVVDLCAAPGGKTLQLAAAGHSVTALDISEHRLKRVSENLARTGLTANLLAADALEWSPEKPLDAVLLDAPCSATGTIRRHPELPHLRTPEELDSNVDLQAALLARALCWLKPGGHLVYAVCSLEMSEGDAQLSSGLPDGYCLVDETRLMPGALSVNGNDGFYYALIRKAG